MSRHLEKYRLSIDIQLYTGILMTDIDHTGHCNPQSSLCLESNLEAMLLFITIQVCLSILDLFLSIGSLSIWRDALMPQITNRYPVRITFSYNHRNSTARHSCIDTCSTSGTISKILHKMMSKIYVPDFLYSCTRVLLLVIFLKEKMASRPSL